ncbi:MAG: amidohydrolase [Ilumatobacteraceae bacterium]
MNRPAHLHVFTAAKVRTMDIGRPEANAVAVADGRIVSVGTLSSMQPWLKRIPHTIDDSFSNRVLMPGFIDPHTHLRTSGTFGDLNYVGPVDIPSSDAVSPLADRTDVLARLLELVNESQPGEDGRHMPIVCWGYDPAMQNGHLDRELLDGISDVVPIWVCAYAPHIVYTNSPMLTLINVDEESNFHGLGRYPDGKLNGWFIESHAVSVAMRPVARLVYREGFGLRALKRMGEVARQAGVTTTADMGWGFENFDGEWSDYRQSIDSGDLPLRTLLVPFEPALRRKKGVDALAFLSDMAAKSDDRLAVHGVKFINDGSYPSMTLKLGYPGYLDGEQGLTGETPWDDVFDRMLPYWNAGIPIHSHANGDATIDMTLDVLARLQATTPRFDHRFVIEHYCISTPAQARRLAALGGVASVNAYFVKYRAHLHADSGFGPDRSESTARLGSLVHAGAQFAIHSDYNLVVTPLSPLKVAEIAVTRLGEDGETVLAPGERISLERALRAITVDAAYVLGRDHEIGSIEVGKYADFTVLADDPFEMEAGKIGSIEVVDTVLGGEVTGR